MKTKNILILLAIVVIAVGAGYWIGRISTPVQAKDPMSMKPDSTTGSQETGSGRKILYWKAPMDPTEIYDHPGKSKMGMKLVPVYAGEAQTGNAALVKIDPVMQQDMGVRTARVKSASFSTTIRAVAMVKYDQQQLYSVSTKISGWIDTLYINYTGQKVRKGEPMLGIYSPELVTTQREYLLALNTKDILDNSDFREAGSNGGSLVKAARKRLKYWDIPDAEIKRLKKTGKVRKNLTLRAPATGVVIKKNVIGGSHIKAGTALYQIADLSKVWVEASVYSNELPWIHKGQTVEMQLSYLPGKTFTGKISYIYPYLNKKTRSIKVRIVFDNSEGLLKPGMYANVLLHGKTIPHATVIPSSAVLHTGKRTVVVEALGNGYFKPKEVTLGVIGGPHNRKVRVLSGLKPGDRVVTSAQFLFNSASNLQEAIQKMLRRREGSDMNNMQMNENSMKGHPMQGASSDSMKMQNSMNNMKMPSDSSNSMKEMQMQDMRGMKMNMDSSAAKKMDQMKMQNMNSDQQ